MSPADPFALVGQVLDGQFRVDQLVGEGGFSVVYRGHHQGLNEPIAIKCLKLPAALGTSLVDTFVQRFRDESRILYRLSQGNLNIVRSVAAGTTQAPNTGAIIPYMVLEWLEGRSLQNDFTVRRTVGEKGRTLEQVVKLFESAADGLAYAHAQGVVHRDLNPGNLYLASTPQGVKMKVLDFGVAKIMHDGALNLGPRAQTVGQIRIFAPAYGAPEQFDDRIGPVGAWSDVYAFALVLMEALRDRTVNEGAHLGDFANTTTDPSRRPTPRLLGLDVPDEVEAAFERATLLDPKDRWQSAGDFWKSLTIAMKVASEHKYEKAARETPPLAMGTPKKMAGTMPLGSKIPEGVVKGAHRPRMATTIGIPPVRAGAAPAPPPAPAGRLPAEGPPEDEDSFAQTTMDAPRPRLGVPSSKPMAAVPQLGEEEEEEATKVKSPGADVLRSLARDAMQAAAPSSGRVPPPSAKPASKTDRPSPIPPSGAGSGGTMMMAPNDAQAARAMAMQRQQHMIQEQQQALAQQPQHAGPQGALGSTLAMGSGGFPFPQPAQHAQHAPPPQQAHQAPQGPAMPAPGMQGIPGAHGTPPRGVPAVSGGPPYGQVSAAVGGHPGTLSHTPPAPMVGQPQFGQRPTGEHAPFGASSAMAQPPSSPAKPLPIVPIVAGLAVLALAGLGLGIYALRAKSNAATDADAVASSASAVASMVPTAAPTPTEPAPAATTTATTEEADAGSVAAAEPEDAATAAAATESPSANAPPPQTAATAVAPPPTTAAAPVTAAAPTTSPLVTAFTPSAPSTGAAGTASAKAPADPNAWNEGAARAKLGIANGVLIVCKKDGAVTGTGNAMVTFAPDGTVSGVAVMPPFAGTPAGDCVAAQFRRVKVNPFNGSPQTVRHTFDVPK